jgi:hypothetical protein
MSNENPIPGSPADSPAPASALQRPPERPRWEQERELVFSFFRLVNRSTSLQNLIDEAIKFFQQDTQCEAVAIRLRQGSDYPYFKALGFPAEFLRRENSLCSRDCFGEAVPDTSGALSLECRCGDVICGRFDPSQPFASIPRSPSSPLREVSGPTAPAMSAWLPPGRKPTVAAAALTATNPSP